MPASAHSAPIDNCQAVTTARSPGAGQRFRQTVPAAQPKAAVKGTPVRAARTDRRRMPPPAAPARPAPPRPIRPAAAPGPAAIQPLAQHEAGQQRRHHRHGEGQHRRAGGAGAELGPGHGQVEDRDRQQAAGHDAGPGGARGQDVGAPQPRQQEQQQRAAAQAQQPQRERRQQRQAYLHRRPVQPQNRASATGIRRKRRAPARSARPGRRAARPQRRSYPGSASARRPRAAPAIRCR